MPKPRIPNQRKANLEHKKRIELYCTLIQQVYDKIAQESARVASLAGADPNNPFSFSDYPLTKEAIKKLQSQLMSEVGAIIMSGTSAEWKESNLVQDLVAKRVLTAYTGTNKHGDEFSRYFQTNPEALTAFQQRKDEGMNLSSRVWSLSEQYKSELEESISAAIAPGIPAMELAAQVKQYLKNPDKRFRRIKEKMEDGTIKWHLSKPAKAYHPGQGVYRSSARNAQRLARTEINMAYRTAEQERWKQFDFVVGYEVKTTQNGHHVEDICDQLAGKYPKDFVFKGWHPQCYSDDSEVLTDNGWKLLKDVIKSDKILSLNPDTRELEWVGIADMQCYEHNGDMIHFFNKSLDCLVTPEHRMVYEANGIISDIPALDYNDSLGGFIDGESKFEKDIVPYSGKVYDLSLERNHIMYIRKNGKCFWGSNCMCYTIPILKTEDEFWSLDEDKPSVNEVNDVPDNFKDWIADNSDRIEKATERGTLPYFIKDNRSVVDDVMEVESEKRKSEKVERERIEANRKEYERLKADANYSDVAFNPENGGLKATHVGHEEHSSKDSKKFFDKFTTTDLEKMCQDILFENGFSCILANEHVFDTHTGKQLTALDTITNGRYMDIFSITKNGKNTISNGFKRKKKQLLEFNELYGTDFHQVIIFFYDDRFYNENTVRNCLGGTIKEAIVVFGNGKVTNISKKIKSMELP